MNKNSFRYILRFTIQPGYYEENRLEGLITFCKQAGIDDVMFFADCEELNTGHITAQELTPWLELISRAKLLLQAEGITTSINPWTTLLHADRGRRLKPGQDFRTMVDPCGRRASAQACPLCGEWRKYIAEIYALYATVKPEMIWVEDDFRFHNHAPLDWGGCFCEAHMSEFSAKAGKALTREEFLEGVLRPGEPHPYRKIWLDTCRETLVDIARIIGKAVHEVSPDTRVGLMSSVPAVHCAEGRDWQGILKGLSGDKPMVNRPHLPAYVEDTPQNYLWNFSSVSRLTRAMVPPDTEIYPELDNGPFYRFSKSKTFTRLQLETSLHLDADGITLSLFDMIGSGVKLSEGYQIILSESKAFINLVRRYGLGHMDMEGVRVLADPEASYHLHTPEGKSMKELYPEESFWASLLSSYGIPNVYTLEKHPEGRIVAISGQYFRNLSKAELYALFRSNFIILDGEAAFTLHEMGMGSMIGMGEAVWHTCGNGFYSYEEVYDGKAYCGIPGGRLTAQGDAGEYLEIRYRNDPCLITEVKNPSRTVVGAGMALLEGKCLILPFGRFQGRHRTYLNPLRQQIVQEVLKQEIKSRNMVFVEGDPYIFPSLFQAGEKTLLLLSNFSNDGLEKIKIFAPGLDERRASELRRDTEKAAGSTLERMGDYLMLNGGIGRQDVIAILFEA